MIRKKSSRRPEPFVESESELRMTTRRLSQHGRSIPLPHEQRAAREASNHLPRKSGVRLDAIYPSDVPAADPVSPPPPIRPGGNQKQRSVIGKWMVRLILGLITLGVLWVYRSDLLNILRIAGHSVAWAGIMIVPIILAYLTGMAAHRLSKRGLRRWAFFFCIFCSLVICYITLNIAAAPICDADIDSALKKMAAPGYRVIYARRGQGYERIALPLDRRISSVEVRDSALFRAVPAIEDERFGERITGPLDPEAILRATVQTFILHRKQGGSTLLVQTAKLIQGKLRSSWLDKPYQFLMAFRLNQRFPTPEEQLAFYLNLADLSGTHGVAWAAADFFGVSDLRDLKLAEPEGAIVSATLAGMLQAPGDYNPRAHPQEALARRNLVLRKMSEAGMINDLAMLQAQPIKVRQSMRGSSLAFFARAIRERTL